MKITLLYGANVIFETALICVWIVGIDIISYVIVNKNYYFHFKIENGCVIWSVRNTFIFVIYTKSNPEYNIDIYWAKFHTKI